MPQQPLLRRSVFPVAPLFLLAFSLIARALQISQPSGPARISMEQENHHRLVFENAYVKVFYVEIPAHESTLYHRHDLPYVSFPPPSSSDSPSPAVAGNGGRMPLLLRVGYSAGNFSHAVSNSSDAALRNVAIELLRPQGTVRNRCQEVLRGQPLNCDKRTASSPSLPSHFALFETDEIAVEYWEIAPGSTVRPADARVSTLVGGMSGIVDVTGGGDSRMVPQAGLVWLLADSQATLEAGKGSSGHFVMIRFKDSSPTHLPR